MVYRLSSALCQIRNRKLFTAFAYYRPHTHCIRLVAGVVSQRPLELYGRPHSSSYHVSTTMHIPTVGLQHVNDTRHSDYMYNAFETQTNKKSHNHDSHMNNSASKLLCCSAGVALGFVLYNKFIAQNSLVQAAGIENNGTNCEY